MILLLKVRILKLAFDFILEEEYKEGPFNHQIINLYIQIWEQVTS